MCPSHPPHRYICYIRYTAAPFLISRRQVSVLPDEVTSPSPRDEPLPPPLQLNCDHIFNVVTPIDPVSNFLSPLVKATPQGPHLRSVVDAAAVLNPMVQPPGEASYPTGWAPPRQLSLVLLMAPKASLEQIVRTVQKADAREEVRRLTGRM